MKSTYELIAQAKKVEVLSEEMERTTQQILAEDSISEKINILKHWLARRQPCLFGRIASTDEKQLGVGICWITQEDIENGDEYIRTKIQHERRKWKDQAVQGLSHGFLLMFSGEMVSRVAPGPALTALGKRMAELFLPEAGVIKADHIYTEAIPLRYPDGMIYLHKGGVNMFYPSADGTLNHDRRMPGGILFSVNGPGHFAQSLLLRGMQKTMKEAVQYIYSLTVRSIGNGGIGLNGADSCTWHKRKQGNIAADDPIQSLGKKLPYYVPDDFDRESFSGNYHTDILIPRFITENKNSSDTSFQWKSIYYDYFSDRPLPYHHPNFGWWKGMPVPDEAMYFNPWPPELPINGDWRESPFWSKMCELHPELEQ